MPMDIPPEDALSRLVLDLSAGGAELAAIRVMIEEASDRGAHRALTTLGLEDEEARADMDELRELLRAWRDAKSSAVKAVFHWLIRLVVALALIGLAAKFGVRVDGASLPEIGG